jgi:hypothetical protein
MIGDVIEERVKLPTRPPMRVGKMQVDSLCNEIPAEQIHVS